MSQSVRGLTQKTNGAPILRAGARLASASGDAGSSRGLCCSYFPRCRLSTMDPSKQVVNFGPGPAKLPHSVRWPRFGRSAGIGMQGVGMQLSRYTLRCARRRDAAIEMQLLTPKCAPVQRPVWTQAGPPRGVAAPAPACTGARGWVKEWSVAGGPGSSTSVSEVAG